MRKGLNGVFSNSSYCSLFSHNNCTKWWVYCMDLSRYKRATWDAKQRTTEFDGHHLVHSKLLDWKKMHQFNLVVSGQECLWSIMSSMQLNIRRWGSVNTAGKVWSISSWPTDQEPTRVHACTITSIQRQKQWLNGYLLGGKQTLNSQPIPKVKKNNGSGGTWTSLVSCISVHSPHPKWAKIIRVFASVFKGTFTLAGNVSGFNKLFVENSKISGHERFSSWWWRCITPNIKQDIGSIALYNIAWRFTNGNIVLFHKSIVHLEPFVFHLYVDNIMALV